MGFFVGGHSTYGNPLFNNLKACCCYLYTAMNYINYNGKLLDATTALVGAGNRGLRYGDGLFETMKVNNGKLQFAADHFDRLWHGLGVLGFELPPLFTKEKLQAEVIALGAKNGHLLSGRTRLNLFRGEGGLFDAENNYPNYIIESWSLSAGYSEFNPNGLVLAIYADARKTCDVLANLKHNNYLPYVLAALHAKKEKCNDALLLNSMGRICDSTIANIFIVKNQQVITPGLDEGCVAGVLRKNLIAHLAATGFNISEKAVTIDDVLTADEVFLTNSMFNIRWVQRIADRAYRSDYTRKIYASFLPTIF